LNNIKDLFTRDGWRSQGKTHSAEALGALDRLPGRARVDRMEVGGEQKKVAGHRSTYRPLCLIQAVHRQH
jgi:hypothetical protein